MPGPEENPAGPLAQKSPFKPVDSDQFQISTRRLRVPVNPLPIFLIDFPCERLEIPAKSNELDRKKWLDEGTRFTPARLILLQRCLRGS
jgi:hypothetical protein